MAEKTDRFASIIKTQDQLPVDLREIYNDVTAKYGASRLSLYAPPLTNLPARDQPNFGGCVLAIFDDHLAAVFESGTDRARSLEIPFEDIISLELGNILLYSWFKISFGNHYCREIKIPFNTVTEPYFRSALFLIRETVDTVIENDLDPKVLTQRDLPLKFLNAFEACLLPGERVFEYAFQPEIRASRLIFYNEQIAPPFLVVITDRQVIVIVEEAATSRMPVEQYGETYHYCPIERYDNMDVIRKGPKIDLSDFHLSLVNGNARQIIESQVESAFVPQFACLSERARTLLTQ
jgi:hypothetical protein